MRKTPYYFVQKALRNKKVLRLLLKLSTDSAILTSIGREFQSFGAAMKKDRSPHDFKFDLGTTNKHLSPDLRLDLFGTYFAIRLLI